MSTLSLWLIIITAGLVTFAVRLSFIALLGKMNLPVLLERGLRYVPVAVLPALIAPALFFQQGQLALSWGNERLVAGLVAIIVSVYTKNMLLTIGAGMLMLWGLQFIFG
ncbi:MAG TPA: AzlD domain-containing protein [Anaerolineae bacterium]|nr:AzlD domain-containing protein [Anaerolineae bacterium]MCB9103563.1 AzlD domain-containing protein [Anaerolineales bacterium]HRV96235.1 AzlD domain-containing protein [Anaerolineae bacterium]